MLIKDFQGYKYAIFDRVSADKTAFIDMWEELGFEVIGHIPQAANSMDNDGIIDAPMMGRELTG